MHRSISDAAHCMGISYRTAVNHVSGIHERLDVASTFQAYLVIGWLRLP